MTGSFLSGALNILFHSGTEFTESETNELMTDREVHSLNFVFEGVINTITICVFLTINYFTSTENINGAAYCVGPEFKSLHKIGHCDCGFPQHLQQNVFTIHYI